MTNLIIAVFVVGYACIALEGYTKVSKTAVALLMAVLCWTLYLIGANGSATEIVNGSFMQNVAETSETIFFLMGAMTVVEVVDSNGGFNFVSSRLRTRSPKALLWRVVFITFLLSALLDNMTTSIVMVMVLKRLVPDKRMRMLYAGIVVLAANAGGAFSPIGDVTTIMLWIKGCVSTVGIIKGLLIPSIVSVAIPALCIQPLLKGEIQFDQTESQDIAREALMPDFSRVIRIWILVIGVAGLMFVPVFRQLTGLPPFVGVMGVLAILWTFTEVVLYRKRNRYDGKQLERAHVSNLLRRIDMSTILFFLGILLCVGAVGETGALTRLGEWLNTTFQDVYVVDTLIGMLSSIVDNVPLVASAMGMYPIAPDTATGIMQNYCQDGTFWELLAYCAGTGGSILIIGSAAGVVVMGLERISFGWYLKRFTWLALVGYFAGILCYWLLKTVGL